jgi:dolichol-phosphate mannosyltransferase
MDERPVLSIVLPVFNEAEIIRECVREVAQELEKTRVSFEIVCVDDGSSDATAEVLEHASREDPRVVAVHFSRNFGKEAALSAGLEAARGRAVLLMDSDLQHPPSLIPRLIERWREGYDVVEAAKDDRGEESWLYRASTQAFYLMMGRAVGRNLRDSSDFKLLDRQVVDALLAFPERRRFFRGLVAWVGFRVARVPFRVQERRGGRTKWSSRALFGYSIRNLVAFSSAPLRVVAYAGFATVGVAVLLAIETLYYWFSGRAVSGFTTVILVMLFLCGLILVSLGAIAIYVASIYDEQKARPLFLVRRPRPSESRDESAQRAADPGSAPPAAARAATRSPAPPASTDSTARTSAPRR